MRVSFAVTRRQLVHLSCTALHCTSRKMVGFVGCGELCCEFCDQPSTQMAVNRVKVRHSARPCFKHGWGCQGSLRRGWLQPLQRQDPAGWCRPHCCKTSHLAGGWFLAERRDNQQQGGTPATSAQGDRRSPCGGFPVPSTMLGRNVNPQLRKDFLLLLRYAPK